MERRKFIKTCCYSAIGIPLIGIFLQSCGTIYYANIKAEGKKLIVPKSEFLQIKKDKTVERSFVFVQPDYFDFPICLYRIKENYYASLLKCTHRGCELNVGGGIYSCPCHGSEFDRVGNVVQDPANQPLYRFATKENETHIFVDLPTKSRNNNPDQS